MQLWKKNFLLVFVAFQSVLFTGLLLFVGSSFYGELDYESERFSKMVDSSQTLIRSIIRTSSLNQFNDLIISLNEQQQFYYEISIGENVVFNSIPDINIDVVNDETPHLMLIKQGANYYFKYEHFLLVDNHETHCVYVADISSVYANFYKRILVSITFGILLSFLISGIIYYQMKKMYRPVQNLSHELRTPLTLIAGYSELLMRIKTTEEEKINMSQAIHDESSRLLEIIEQLLIMGALKDGDILREPLLISELIAKIGDKYPYFEISINNEEKITGNKVLLVRLLDNLLANAFKASDKIQVAVNERKLIIKNGGATIPPKQLKKMNRGQKLSVSEYSGSGQGFIICREIVLLHNGSIKITSDEESTKVEISF